jgi:subtilisin family serine protease
VGVGASDKKSQPADFTNFGTGVDLLAPGVEVFSTYPQDKGHLILVKSHWGSESKDLSYFSVKGALEVQEDFSATLLDVGLGEFSDYQNKNVSDQIVLIQSSLEEATVKIKTALAFGAKAFLLHNKNPSNWDLDLADPLALTGVLIDSKSAQQLMDQIRQGEVKVSFNKKATGFQELSGTSMSSAFVAGTVALMKSVNRSLTPQQIQEILKSSCINGILNAKNAVSKAEQANQN